MKLLAVIFLLSLGSYPIEDLRLNIFGLLVPAPSLILALILIILIHHALVMRRNDVLSSVDPKLVALSVLLGGLLTMSTIGAGAVSRCDAATLDNLKWIPYIIGFPLLAVILSRLSQNAMWSALLVACSIAVVLGYYRFLFLEGGVHVEHLLGYWGIRYTPATRNSDVLYPLVAAILSAGLIRNASSQGMRAILTLSAILSITAVVLTQSRSGWIALLVAAVMMYWTVFRPLRSEKGGAVWILLAIVVPLVIVASLQEQYADLLLSRAKTILGVEQEVGEASNVERMERYTSVVTVMASNPLGIGVGNFSCAVGEIDREVKHAENAYLTLTMEGGWVAGVSFVAILLYLFQRLRKQAQNSHAPDGQVDGMSITLLVSLAVYFLFNDEVNSLFVWSLLAVVASVVPRRQGMTVRL
jgi:O-antigen ligase